MLNVRGLNYLRPLLLIGIFGQMVYVDPSRQLVIAQVGAWPRAMSDALVAARREFVAAIKHAMDAEREQATHD